jgi:short-subunit dehydrogenase
MSSEPVAAVTGASRGIGRATALELARLGHRVFALARSEADLYALADDACRIGLWIEPFPLDIADDESRERAVAHIFEATGGRGVDVLVNNAGYGQLGPVEEVSVEKLRLQMEINVIGLHAFTLPFLPAMRERRRGWIVNVSSAAGRVATPFMGAYSASKFALEALSDSMRVELAPFGVHVILIEPGPIRTRFGQTADEMRDRDPFSPYATFLKRWNARRGKTNILERSADSVARRIGRAIQSRRPRPRYTITLSAKLGTVARRLVPDAVMDWFFRRAIGREP